MITEKLETLKEKLLESTDFRSPCEYFMDYVSDDYDMRKLEHPVPIPPKIMAVVAATGSAVLGKKNPRIRQVLLLEVSGEDFVHGTGFIDDRLFTFFCFTDIDKGMIAVSLGGHRVTFARLSIMTLSNEHSDAIRPEAISMN